MSNVIQFRSRPQDTPETQKAQLIDGIVSGRRQQDDVFWLKEVAELLGMLKATQAELVPDALEPLRPFYREIEERLRFFPQYYRFLLSICLDLEDLGMAGQRGERAAHWVASEGLAEAELSDLQRAEARRLLARRGADIKCTRGLDARLHDFINRSETFALPNKKAAYELTHIVFYLSEYGLRDPRISRAARTSLTYCGLMAFIDQNADLLAEVCTAMRFAGATPSPIWEAAVAQAHDAIGIDQSAESTLQDSYHEYLVTGWSLHVAGAQAFTAEVPGPNPRFYKKFAAHGALRALSQCMFDLGNQRSGDWARMRPKVLLGVGEEGHAVLKAAEESSELFEPFFANFARAGQTPHISRLH